MEVAASRDTSTDNTFQSFCDILETIRCAEEAESADELMLSSDEDSDDKLFYDNVETLFETGSKDGSCVSLVDGNDLNSDAEFSCNTEEKDQLHRLTHHSPEEEKFKCDVCDKYVSKLYIDRHMNLHKGVRFQCTLCNKTFADHDALENHLEHHKSPDRKYVSCSICEKMFASEVSLNLHMETHEGTQKLVCNTCDARFSRKTDLQRHMHIHTGEKPHRCSLCPKAFRQPGELGRHMAWHRGDHTCKYCGRKYVRKDELLRHVSKHEQNFGIQNTSLNKALQCGRCHKFLSNETNLQMHLKTHEREEYSLKYTRTCNTCEKTFSRKSNLNRHMREVHGITLTSHTKTDEEKSQGSVCNGLFVCDLCSKIYKNKRGLAEHVKFVHLKTYTHACDMCDKSFDQKKYLTRHKKRKHDK